MIRHEAALEAGLRRWGMAPARPELFPVYLELLLRWREKINLTAHRTAEEIVEKDFLDSLFVGRHLEGVRALADVGSGAGFPGLPLAIAFPRLRVLLVESRRKKAVFLREAIAALGLAGQVDVLEGRAEDVLEGRSFEAAVSRAALGAGDMLDLILPRLPAGGRIILMKGPRAAEYLSGIELPPGVRLSRSAYELPESGARRQLLIFEREMFHVEHSC